MASGIATVFGLFFVGCLLPVEADADFPLTLKTLTRSRSSDKEDYIFHVTFQSPSRPDVVWAKGFSPEDEFSGSLTYDEGTHQGSAQLTMKRDSVDEYIGVFTKLGSIPDHYFVFHWNVTGEQELTTDFNYVAAEVSPGTDIAYTAGQRSEVTFTAQNTRGGLTCNSNAVVLYGKYLLPETKGIISKEPRWLFLVENIESSEEGVTTTTDTFLTDQYKVNGHFHGRLYCEIPYQPGSALSTKFGMDEEFELILHANNETGPYPDDFTGASFGEFLDVKRCNSDDSECHIRCGGAGNDLDKVEVFKMSVDGSRKLVASSSEVNRYEINVGIGLSTRADLGGMGGMYVCKVTQKGGLRSAEDTVIVNVNRQTRPSLDEWMH